VWRKAPVRKLSDNEAFDLANYRSSPLFINSLLFSAAKKATYSLDPKLREIERLPTIVIQAIGIFIA